YLAASRFLGIDPSDELIGYTLSGDLLVPEHVGERVLCSPLVRVLCRVHLGENLAEAVTDRHEVVPALWDSPGTSMARLIALGQLLEESALLEPPLDAGNDEVLRQADVTVELGQDDLAHRIRIVESLTALDLEGYGTHLGIQLDLAEA